ncbi:hypothetical protein SprV_0100163900 [Sparganum proliferum]
MGRRYYCDYCNVSFPDNLLNRRNHLKGVRHVQLRAEYLQRFQDPESVLLTERGKPLCISFAKAGVCQFGQCCRYSHLTPELESRLNYQIAQQKQFSVADPVQAARDLEERVKQRLTGLRDSEVTLNSLPINQVPPSIRHCLSSSQRAEV